MKQKHCLYIVSCLGLVNPEVKTKKLPRQHLCRYCGRKFAYLKHLQNHMNDAHSGRPKYSCDVCSKGHSTKKALQDHVRRTHEVPHILCEICPASRKPFKSTTAFENHNKIFHQERICNKCSFKCADKHALDTHKKIHKKYKRKILPCTFCPTKLVGTSSLKKHIRCHHPIAHSGEEEVVEMVADVVSMEIVEI